MRRVREMQRIANSRVNAQPASPPPSEQTAPSREKSAAPTAPAEKTPASSAPSNQNASSAGVTDLLGGILSRLGLEQDRLIILLLLIVLMKEGTDQKLLLALCYLLL